MSICLSSSFPSALPPSPSLLLRSDRCRYFVFTLAFIACTTFAISIVAISIVVGVVIVVAAIRPASNRHRHRWQAGYQSADERVHISNLASRRGGGASTR